jgi:hypothetical protein
MASVFMRVLDNLRRFTLGVAAEGTLAATDESEGGSRDLFDELPDPPHLEYGEVHYRNGRFKYFDG